MTDNIKDLAILAADGAEEKKAYDIEILDVRELTTIADYFVICSGKSEVQVQAIAREIEEYLEEEKGILPQQTAGSQEAQWILLDYADVIVHVFKEDKRQYYELERLWADAEKLLQRNSG